MDTWREKERRAEIGYAKAMRWTGEDYEDPQTCGCVIYHRIGGESCRVTVGCETHGGMLIRVQTPVAPLEGRARLVFDEEV